MAHLHKSNASLRISGDALVPEDISKALGGPPTLSYIKGEAHSPAHNTVTRKTGLWLREAAQRQPEDMDGQIAEILGKLSQDLTVWRHLSATYEIDLFCGLFMAETDEGVEISTDSLNMLGQRGIKFGFCVYAPAPSYDSIIARRARS